MRERGAAPAGHGVGGGQGGDGGRQAKAVVALEDAQREVLQLGRLMAYNAAVAAHLHTKATRTAVGGQHYMGDPTAACEKNSDAALSGC